MNLPLKAASLRLTWTSFHFHLLRVWFLLVFLKSRDNLALPSGAFIGVRDGDNRFGWEVRSEQTELFGSL